MPSKSVSPSRQKIAQAKLLYDAGVAPLSEIQKLLGMSAGQFRRFREREGWPLRPAACVRKDAPAAAVERPQAQASGNLIARLEDAVEREFARAEAALEKQTPKSMETTARTLATLVRTLAELKRMRSEAQNTLRQGTLREEHDTDDGGAPEPPRELAELRAELARRLERLRGQGPTE